MNHRKRGRPAAAHPSCYICSYCSRNFKRREHLDRHLRTHTKEKPFRCGKCEQSFSRRDLLRRHERIAHGGISQQASHEHRKSDDSLSVIYTEAEQSQQTSPSGPVDEDAFQSAHALVPPEDIEGSESRNADDMNPIEVPSSRDDPAGRLDVPHEATMLNGYAFEPPSEPESWRGIGVVDTNPFENFEHFLSSIGLPSELAPPELFLDAHLSHPPSSPPGNQENNLTDPKNVGSPFQTSLPTVSPTGQNLHVIGDPAPKEVSGGFNVDDRQRNHFISSLNQFSTQIAGFQLPSRYTLTRYLSSYFEGFNSHLLVFHVPTFELTAHLPELILALMATGAQYRLEHRNARRFFEAARAILSIRLAQTAQPILCSGSADLATYLSVDRLQALDIMRCLLVLMGYATWEGRSMIHSTLELREELTRMLKGFECSEPSAPDQLSWAEWIHVETARRTKLIGFCFAETFTILYNARTSLYNSEINVRLPCSTREWMAPTEQDWLIERNAAREPQPLYREALSLLFRGPDSRGSVPFSPSPLGNFILLHGLLQRIYIARQLSTEISPAHNLITNDELDCIEKALRTWVSIWQEAPESSLVPANENGPLPFTSSALLALAYVRLFFNIGPYRMLETRDPRIISKALISCPPPPRSTRTIPGVIYALYTIGIPVRLGLDSVARSQAFFWSVRYALANFECTVLLSKWLILMRGQSSQELTQDELRLLHWTHTIVDEACESLDIVDGDGLYGIQQEYIAYKVVAITARLFQQNTQWSFINMLGESLELYSKSLRGS